MAAGMCRWYMTCTDLTDACHPGDEQLAKEFVLHWYLSEEVVDFIVLTVYSACPFPDHVGKNKTGLCKESRNVLMKGTTGNYDEDNWSAIVKAWLCCKKNSPDNLTIFKIMLEVHMLSSLTIEPWCGVLCPQQGLGWRVSGNNRFTA